MDCWDNIDNEIVEKLQKLYEHRNYVEEEIKEIEKKQGIMLKQKNQIKKVGEGMLEKAELRIEKEKDILLDYFDQQILQECKKSQFYGGNLEILNNGLSMINLQKSISGKFQKSRSVSFDLKTRNKRNISPISENLNTTMKNLVQNYQVSNFNSTLQMQQLQMQFQKTQQNSLEKKNSYSGILKLNSPKNEFNSTNSTIFPHSQDQSSILYKIKQKKRANKFQQSEKENAEFDNNEDYEFSQDITLNLGKSEINTSHQLNEKLQELEEKLNQKEQENSQLLKKVKNLVRENQEFKRQISMMTQNEIDTNFKVNLKQKEIDNNNLTIQKFEKIIDSIFEAQMKNEQETILLTKTIEKQNKKMGELDQKEKELVSTFQTFQNKLTSILQGYSTKLNNYNKKENYYQTLIIENSTLKQERDELISMLKGLQLDIQRNNKKSKNYE